MRERTLYIRHVPEELARRAKAAAARDGISLTAFVVRALEQAVGARGPVAGESTIRPDMDWSEANKSRLMSKYPGQYLAIIDRRVVDHDAQFSPLAQRVFKRFGNRPIFMPKCEPEREIRLRSPRVADA